MPVPDVPREQYRGLGTLLLVISAPLLIAGIVLQFYPTGRQCVTYDFFGGCAQGEQTYPYAGGGDVLLFFFVLALIVGLVFYFWRPSETPPPLPVQHVYHPFVQYVPMAAPPPPYTPGPPPGYATAGQVVVNIPAQQAPRIMMHCRNCGSLYDATLGRCDKCGAPAT